MIFVNYNNINLIALANNDNFIQQFVSVISDELQMNWSIQRWIW